MGTTVADYGLMLEHALTAVPGPIEWTEADDLASQPAPPATPAGPPTTAH